MRFLILTQYFPPEIGAPQTRLAAVSRELQREGHEVEVVTALPNYPQGRIFPGYQGTFYRFEERNGIRLHRLWLYASVGRGLKRILNYVSFAIFSFWGLLKARKPDYIFVESPSLFLGIPGFVVSRFRHVPLVFNVSDIWPDSICDLGVMRDGLLMSVARALESWIYRKADFVNAITEGIRLKLIGEKHVPFEKLLFFPNGVDTEMFAPIPPDEALRRSLHLQDKAVVLYAGTLGYAHALETALQAANLLRADKAIHFLFVGHGSNNKNLMKLAEDLGLDNVTFLEPVPVEQVRRYFSIARCGLVSLKDIPLFQGARPSKIFTIMACAKPVIFCGSGEGARLVGEANAGLVVQPESPEALAGAVQKLARNPKLGEELGRNGRKFVEENYGWPTLVPRWLRDLTRRAPGDSIHEIDGRRIPQTSTEGVKSMPAGGDA
jgi:colanic acid biosynthesis glycosyl transferase WcaI